MTAKVGCDSFTTKKSKNSEYEFTQAVGNVLSEREFSDFTLGEGYTINECYGADLARTKKRNEETSVEPDSGTIFYRGKLVGFGDNKWQTSPQNAVERVNLYFMDAIAFGLEPWQVFCRFDGPAFEQNSTGQWLGGAGKQVVRCLHHGTTVVHGDQTLIENKFRNYLRRIVKKYKTS